jgi:hypothetical protein
MSTLSLKPTIPLALAGQMIEPLVSVPMDAAASEAAVAVPELELEPHGLRSNIFGLRTCPPKALQPLIESSERKFAHWLKFVLPKMSAPWCFYTGNKWTVTPRNIAIKAQEPTLEGILSCDSMLSLSKIGTPCKSPLISPFCTLLIT